MRVTGVGASNKRLEKEGRDREDKTKHQQN